jgi:hypothetical protein
MMEGEELAISQARATELLDRLCDQITGLEHDGSLVLVAASAFMMGVASTYARNGAGQPDAEAFLEQEVLALTRALSSLIGRPLDA